MSSRVRIVLGNGSLVGYPEGGGHWSFFLQYLFGLSALGHDVFWLELVPAGGEPSRDRRRIGRFLRRVRRYGFADRCAVLVHDPAERPSLESAEPHGMTGRRLGEVVRSADLLWNFACAVRQPLLSLFRRRVLLDVDPGHLQVAALTCDLDIQAHDVLLTTGLNFGDPECEAPSLGREWRRFRPIVYLPMWPPAGDPGPRAPFTSVTQWTWEELWLDGRVLSVSKRDAYLAYLELPPRAGRPFELATNIHPLDRTGDRELLERHGWRLVHPHRVAASPGAYRRYIRRSRGEILCPKPIHRALRTGWFSERSAGYLATGRPVVAEDTGFTRHVPVGHGLLAFRTLEEAAAAVADIDARYSHHMKAARDLAESYFDARRCLPAMLAASG